MTNATPKQSKNFKANNQTNFKANNQTNSGLPKENLTCRKELSGSIAKAIINIWWAIELFKF